MKIHTDFSYDKNNPHINLANGKGFFLFCSQPCDFDILAIAHSLARLPRFGGHCLSERYSVGHHSIRVADAVRKLGGSVDEQLWGLLHDASESIIGDIPTPLKECLVIRSPKFNGELPLSQFERYLQFGIANRFNLLWPIPPIVHKADSLLFQRETEEQFDTDAATIDWPVQRVYWTFLERFCDLQEQRRSDERSKERNQCCGHSEQPACQEGANR